MGRFFPRYWPQIPEKHHLEIATSNRSRFAHRFDEVLRILLQNCDALRQVHGYGIVHRDLKTENVMILPDGKIKLMDFGLAHYDTSRMTREEEILGSVYYLSPEQALGKAVDARTDIYTLGILSYELATGRLPFTGEHAQHTI